MHDPIAAHIFDALYPRRGPLPEKTINTIGQNITFLVKYHGGPHMDPSRVSLSIIDVRGPKNAEIGHKATVCVHNAPGDFVVVVGVQVAWGKQVVIGLTEKVDRVIKEILKKEENAGYGDSKV